MGRWANLLPTGLLAKIWPFGKRESAGARIEHDQRWEQEEWAASAGPSSYRHAAADFTEADDDDDDDDDDARRDTQSPHARRGFLNPRRHSASRLQLEGAVDTDDDGYDDR